MKMTSRERFLRICAHETPDRFPIDYLAHPEVDRALRRHFGAKCEKDLLEVLGCDFYYLSCRDISQNESCVPFYRGTRLVMNNQERVCPFGIRWKRGAYDSKFAVDEVLEGPLENASTEKEILAHNWPDPKWFDLEAFHRECEVFMDKVIIGGFWAGILGDSYRMLGFQNFLLNMLSKPLLIKTIVDRITDFYLELNDSIFNEMKGKIDIWFFGNDFGSQEGLLFSKTMFSDYFAQNIKRLTDLAHGYGLKVMMHSCGAISEIIPLLMELGVDILDPIQIQAQGMEPETLTNRFGAHLVFHGGIDTQHTLPFENPEKIKTHVRQSIQILGKCNGYIFAPSQILQMDIPLQNIVTMYKVAKESYVNSLEPKSTRIETTKNFGGKYIS